MSLREQLLDLLRVGPASGYALHHDTVQPRQLVERELSRLVATGELRRIDNLYHVIERPPAPVAESAPIEAPPVAPPVPTEEPDMTIECKKCGKHKPDADMCMRAGKPSRLCKACFGKAHEHRHGGKPKAVKAAKPTALHKVVAKHTAKPNRKENGSAIAATIAELQLRRAVIDQAIEALTRVAA